LRVDLARMRGESRALLLPYWDERFCVLSFTRANTGAGNQFRCEEQS